MQDLRSRSEQTNCYIALFNTIMVDVHSLSCVPSHFRYLIQQLEPPQLPVLIRDRIMKRMRPDIPPEAVETNSQTCSLGTSHFEDTCRHSQTSIRSDDLGACNPLRQFTSFASSELCSSLETARVGCIDFADLFAGAIGESHGGTEVCVEVTVSLQDIELVCGTFFVLGESVSNCRCCYQVVHLRRPRRAMHVCLLQYTWMQSAVRPVQCPGRSC